MPWPWPACGVILRRLQGRWQPRWPIVAEKHLGARTFSGLNLLGFVLVNLLVVLPGVLAWSWGCASLALSHYTDGFVSLRPSGIVLQARKYARDDGRTVVLFPMSHIAESDFYRNVAQSVPSNAVVLMEGVSDTTHLLTNKLSYRRAAKSLHLAEQHDHFKLNSNQVVQADVDVRVFSTNTLALLNLIILFHKEGWNAHTFELLQQNASTPESQQQLIDDLLLKRNAHVLAELRKRLPEAGCFILPWGAAHMMGLSRELQKDGFHLVGTHDFVSIRFGGKPTRDDGQWVPYLAKP